MNSKRLSACAVIIFLALALTGCSRKFSEVSDGSSFALYLKKPVDLPPVVMPNKNPSLPEGKIIYQRLNCAQCHAEDGRGVAGKTTADLADPFANYRLTPTRTYQELTYYLPKKTHPKLPELGNQQIWDLVFYVRSLSHAPLTAAQIAEIEPVFRANCAVCHGPSGFGDGTLAKNLEPQPANFHQLNRMFDRPDSMLYIHMRDGLYPSAMPPWRNFKDTKLNVVFDDAYRRKLVQYVRNFHIDVGEGTGTYYDEKKDAISTEER